jgi:hypothetical protein
MQERPGARPTRVQTISCSLLLRVRDARARPGIAVLGWRLFADATYIQAMLHARHYIHAAYIHAAYIHATYIHAAYIYATANLFAV